MLRFWKNPEFVRHRRSELRQTRALVLVGVVIAICVLVGLLCWIPRGSDQPVGPRGKVDALARNHFSEFSFLFFRVLILIQLCVLSFWSLFACAQAISGERDRKTWDFQRVTRLAPSELLIGKLLGEPLLAYFIVICCVPLTIAAGMMGHARGIDIVTSYVVIITSSLFLGLAGLWLSSLMENKSHGIGIIGALATYVLIFGTYSSAQGYFPGLGGFSPVTSLLFALQANIFDFPRTAKLFGGQVPWLVMSLLLYVTFGAWLLLMTLRNLKRDYGDIRLLSRWQAVGCAAFLDVTVFALFYPPAVAYIGADDFITIIVFVNAIVLYAAGLATLTPAEHLRVWYRNRLQGNSSLFADAGLPWPWLVLSAVVACAFLLLNMYVWQPRFRFDSAWFQLGAIQSLVFCVFIVRDILFIQWCKLTRLRAPVIKGFLYIFLYYLGVWIISLVANASSPGSSQGVLNVLTPFGALDLRVTNMWAGSLLFDVILQLATVAFILWMIGRRLTPHTTLQPAATD
jgi:hypothetical protein